MAKGLTAVLSDKEVDMDAEFVEDAVNVYRVTQI